jgi:hypothetical protein
VDLKHPEWNAQPQTPAELTPADIAAVELQLIDFAEQVHWIGGGFAAFGAHPYPFWFAIRRGAATGGQGEGLGLLD